ncbi:hypothetical protein [Candidatus Nitrosocosmicus hydrocola]|uniref:hypothetical protein n=1 Tax=Candidatus Nitrosocosmicus hydrocola TaxID=1826872 RepID=UPI0011E5D655|nr:hypothetical protein [Candidatus Nitrosocosmicus hydrocola]
MMWHKNEVAIKVMLIQSNLNLNLSNPLLIILMSMFLIVTTVMSSNTESVFAQHHGAPPPMATLGDRNISMNLTIEPKKIISDQDAQLTMHLMDENTGQVIQHVTYRLTISNGDQLKLSEFFHSHTGDLTILARSSDSPHLTVGGTFDVLTNAIVPDPAGKIVVNGPLFSEAGKYDIDVEITTVDNDKTDLMVPLVYHFVANSTNNSVSN